MHGSLLVVYSAFRVYSRRNYPQSCVVQSCYALSGTVGCLYIYYHYVLLSGYTYVMIICYRVLVRPCRALSWMYILHYKFM